MRRYLLVSCIWILAGIRTVHGSEPLETVSPNFPPDFSDEMDAEEVESTLDLEDSSRSPAAVRPMPDPRRVREVIYVPESRALAAHRFARYSLLRHPFSNSFTSLSVELASATIPAPELEDNIKSAGFSPKVDLQYGWRGLAIFGEVSGTIFVGSDAYSALVLGANANRSYGAGVQYEVLKGRHWVVTPSFAVRRSSGSSFSPLNASEKAMTTLADVRGSDFLVKSTTLEYHPSLSAAFAYGPPLGITVEAGRTFKFNDVDGKSGDYRLGAAASTDLHHTIRVPLLLSLFYRGDFGVGEEAGNVSVGGLGIHHTAGRHFDFGLEHSRLFGAVKSASYYFSATYFY